MSRAIRVNEVTFHTAPALDRARGLLGWVSFVVDGRLRLSSIAVRRTIDGRVTLSFPARIDGSGNQRFFVRPIDDTTRREIEAQVFHALGLSQRNGSSGRQGTEATDEAADRFLPTGSKEANRDD